MVRLIEFASIKLHIVLSAKSVAHAGEVNHSAMMRTKLKSC
jgi:hypothetical protein